MAKVLIIYSTTDGHTREICSRLVSQLQQLGNPVELVAVGDAGRAQLEGADKIVIGASIRYGKHSKQVYAFIKQYGQLLDQKKNAFFSVNAVARKPNRNTPETNPYLKRFLTQIAWQPKMLAVFAGKIDYQKYNLFDRSLIRLIMWITKGPTDPQANVEFTDWSQVEQFGQTVNEM